MGFAYAILRSIPNKLGGVVALAASVAVLYTLGFAGRYKIKGTAFYPTNKPLFWSLLTRNLINLDRCAPCRGPLYFGWPGSYYPVLPVFLLCLSQGLLSIKTSDNEA